MPVRTSVANRGSRGWRAQPPSRVVEPPADQPLPGPELQWSRRTEASQRLTPRRTPQARSRLSSENSDVESPGHVREVTKVQHDLPPASGTLTPPSSASRRERSRGRDHSNDAEDLTRPACNGGTLTLPPARAGHQPRPDRNEPPRPLRFALSPSCAGRKRPKSARCSARLGLDTWIWACRTAHSGGADRPLP
jgi:hypothetical protein